METGAGSSPYLVEWIAKGQQRLVFPFTLAYLGTHHEAFSAVPDAGRAWSQVAEVHDTIEAADPAFFRQAVIGFIGAEQAEAYLTAYDAAQELLPAREQYAKAIMAGRGDKGEDLDNETALLLVLWSCKVFERTVVAHDGGLSDDAFRRACARCFDHVFAHLLYNAPLSLALSNASRLAVRANMQQFEGCHVPNYGRVSVLIGRRAKTPPLAACVVAEQRIIDRIEPPGGTSDDESGGFDDAEKVLAEVRDVLLAVPDTGCLLRGEFEETGQEWPLPIAYALATLLAFHLRAGRDALHGAHRAARASHQFALSPEQQQWRWEFDNVQRFVRARLQAPAHEVFKIALRQNDILPSEDRRLAMEKLPKLRRDITQPRGTRWPDEIAT